MRPTARLAILLLACPSVAACGGATTGLRTAADFPARRTVALASPPDAPSVAELSRRFYSAAFDAEAMGREIDTLLRDRPADAELHEMAAHIATLREDSGAEIDHWLGAAQDLRSPFTDLYLWEALRRNLTAREANEALALLELLASRHPSAAVRAQARHWLVDVLERLGRLEDARRQTAAMGNLDHWMLLGAFDNDQGSGFRTRYPPEESIDLAATYQGVVLPIRWRRVDQLDDQGMAPLGDLVSPGQWCVAYLVTWVRSDRERGAQLRVTSTASLTVWVNDAQVAAEEDLEGGASEAVVVPVSLARGWNQILIKSSRRESGEWIVGARLTDERGETLGDVQRSEQAQRFASVAASDDMPTIHFVPPAVDTVVPEARRELLAYRYLARVGLDGDGIAHARGLLTELPDHPLAQFHGAMAFWDNDELGAAIDLLNAGVAGSGEWATAFLWKRARFYRQRDLWDRVIDDLIEAARINPRARFAQMDLAAAFEHQGWEEDRCRVLDRVLTRWPDSAWGLRELGRCLEARGYNDQAERQYQAARALEPGQLWGLERLAFMAWRRLDFGEAIALYERIREIAPTRVSYEMDLGDTLRQAGRRDEARRAYLEAARFDPEWSRPHRRLAVMAQEEGDDRAALEAWQRALEREPDDSRLAERVDFLRAQSHGGSERFVPTDEEVAQAAASASEIEVAPGAHSVYVLDDEVTEVRHDGSSRRTVTQVSLAVTTEGRDDLISTRVPVDARILQAWSRGPDGERREASSIRDGVLRFRGLTVGSVVVLQYIHHAPPPAFLPNQFVSSWHFQGLYRQFERSRWVLILPEGRSVSRRIVGTVAENVERVDGMRVYTWQASRVAPLVGEPLMPPVGDVVWQVNVSTVSDWDDYVQWEMALLSNVFESNDEIHALALRLTEGVDDPRGKLDRLYHHVAQEIRYQQDYEDTIAGVRPHSCPVVIERGYGDCKDKAVLLIQLAREVGVEVRFAVLRTTDAGKVQREVPNQQFNHAIVYVPAQTGMAEGFFLDPTTDGLDMGNLRSDDQGASSLVIDPQNGSYEFIPIPYQGPEMQIFAADLDIDVQPSRQATARASITLRGTGAAAVRRLIRNPEQAHNFYQTLLSQFFGGATLSESNARNADDTWTPLVIDLVMNVSQAIQPQESQLRIQIPTAQTFMYPLSTATALASRQLPMRFGPPDTRRARFHFRLPRRARVVRVPESLELEHPCFSVRQSSVTQGTDVTVTYEYVRRCPELSVENYREFRRVAQEGANRLRAELVFAER